jgi:transcriptional regulator NrdR family protein
MSVSGKIPDKASERKDNVDGKKSEFIELITSDGSLEKFSVKKLERSLIKSGADLQLAGRVVDTIVKDIEKGVCDPDSPKGGACSVNAVYARAFEMLKEVSKVVAARYSLRRSIMQFGPTGFPFEEYISELYRAYGYNTLTGQVVFGGCVPHEVDVVAWKEDELIMAELKYHNDISGKTDLKTALYVKARYDDLKDNIFKYEGMKDRKIDKWVLVTNTRFTDTAINYAQCKGMDLLSWSYPEENNLFSMIERAKLHPVTCLITLSSNEKQQLLQNKVVLCKSIYQNVSILEKLGFSKEKIEAVLEEVSGIINLTPTDK